MKQPKFKYGDRVKVISGFFVGHSGIVKDVLDSGIFLSDYSYRFESNLFDKWIDEKELGCCGECV